MSTISQQPLLQSEQTGVVQPTSQNVAPPPNPNQHRRSTIAGSSSAYIPNIRSQLARLNFKSKLFLGLVCLETLMLIAERSSFDVVLDADNQESKWFFGLMLINAPFMLYFAVDGILNENSYAFISFMGCSIILTIRVSAEFVWRHSICIESKIFPLCMTFYVIFMLFHVVYLIVIPRVIADMGWRWYKLVGGDALLKDMYERFQLFVSLCIMDLQFSILLLFTCFFYLHDDSVVVVTATTALVLEFLLKMLAYWSVRKEFHVGMVFFLIISILLPAQCLFYFMRANDRINNFGAEPALFWRLVFLASMTLFGRACVVLCGTSCLTNFEKKLKERVFDRYDSIL
eukprot:TRINITY_DN38743_c0_g1_i1.p1 TRINITY_DN38743_c0_g1~~TRINITY_DN38743_c0_g1_i1.p1  ORF type:complete len:344 (-),score=2.31 TRINITY_DN38743_c0_g1_i1:59-1090(-)